MRRARARPSKYVFIDDRSLNTVKIAVVIGNDTVTILCPHHTVHTYLRVAINYVHVN